MTAYSLPKTCDEFEEVALPALRREDELHLPSTSELDLVRHFTNLSRKNMGIDTNFYPLGSCTMKYNPRVNEIAANMPPFSRAHPMAPDETVQGCLEIGFALTKLLCEITGMDGGALVPNAGAQGELAGVLMIRAYHRARGDLKRDEILIPDAAHGTNPATAHIAGFKTVAIPTAADGDLDMEALTKAVSERTAGIMLTNPNTLGLLSPRILEIQKMIHEAGGLLYYDGANLNSILELMRPGSMGFDLVHINLHKTFSTPHGGGGPGSGPILCSNRLLPYLPTPGIVKIGNAYTTEWESPDSIGPLASFRGNFAVWLRAYLYARMHGKAGRRRIAERAIIAANYLKSRLSTILHIPYDRPCAHEFVAQARPQLTATDIAKRLLDLGFYAPTIYFPLIVKECLLIEPTETESKATLDTFVDALHKIYSEDPNIAKNAPYTTPVRRLDEVKAARTPVLHGLTHL